MRTHWKMALVFLAATALLLAGCGPGSVDLEVTMTDFDFTPANVSAPAGAEVNLTLVNDGTVEHEWVLVEQGEMIEAPFGDEDEDKIYWEGEVEPGDSETFTFTAPSEPGEYQVVCGIAGHLEAGMEGTLTVE